MNSSQSQKYNDYGNNGNEIAVCSKKINNSVYEIVVEINKRRNHVLRIIDNPIEKFYSNETIIKGLDKLLKSYEGRENFIFIRDTKHKIESILSDINSKKSYELKLIKFIKNLLIRIEKLQNLEGIEKEDLKNLINIQNNILNLLNKFELTINYIDKIKDINKDISEIENNNIEKTYEENSYLYINTKGEKILICTTNEGKIVTICDYNGKKIINNSQKSYINKFFDKNNNKFTRILKTQNSRDKIRNTVANTYKLELEENKRLQKISEINKRLSLNCAYKNSKGKIFLVKIRQGIIIECLDEKGQNGNTQQINAIQREINKGNYKKFKKILTKEEIYLTSISEIEQVNKYIKNNKNKSIDNISQIVELLESLEKRIVKRFGKDSIKSLIHFTHPDRGNIKDKNISTKLTQSLIVLKKYLKEYSI